MQPPLPREDPRTMVRVGDRKAARASKRLAPAPANARRTAPVPRASRAFAFAASAVFAVASGARTARAFEPPVSPGAAASGESSLDRARAAYDRGVRAHALRDYAAAARAFAEADALAPQPASLEAGLEAAMRADDALLGAALVSRAEGRAPDAGLAKTLDAARKRFAGRTGKIRIDCRGEARCLASVDGSAADARQPIVVAPGPHAVVVQRGDERFERLVDVTADGVTVVAAPRRAALGAEDARTEPRAHEGGDRDVENGAETPRRDEARSGISPAWFVAGAAATLAVGAVSIASGLDALAKHDGFLRDGCGASASGPRAADCDERGSRGQTAQLRTNVLLAATAALAVTTAAVGIFAVRWKDGKRARLTLGTSRVAWMAGLELVVP